MNWLIIAAVVALLAWYALWGRAILKDKPWMQWYYASAVGEWVELYVFKKSETIFWQRMKQLAAFLLAVLPQIGAIDVTPYLVMVPEKHRWWVMLIPSTALALDSLIGEIQRYKTTKPIELVAISNEEAAKPAVQEALAAADSVKVEAVAVVVEAKADTAAQGVA